MAIPDKATGASDFSPEGGPEDWLDRDIAALRQSVEREAVRQKRPTFSHATAPPRRLHVIRQPDEPKRSRMDWLLLPPGLVVSSLVRVRGFVRRRRFDIVVYGLCVGVTIGVVLLAISVGAR